MMSERPMLIFVSDLHLTDALHGTAISKKDVFDRFWMRIAAARGAMAAHLVFVGDLFDLVRSPTWLRTKHRPYHIANKGVVEVVDQIVATILEREKGFTDAIRTQVQSGNLTVEYLLGNHDRLLAHAPNARRAIWKALTGQDRDIEFGTEQEYPAHGVLAYHGNISDPINESLAGAATIGDAIGSELILRFPDEVKAIVGADHPHAGDLDDVDDVRPIYAVPAWVRRQSATSRELLQPIGKTWIALVEEFLSNPFVRDWMRAQNRVLGFDTGKKLKLLLELSTSKVMAHTHDQRLTKLYKMMQHAFDGKMALYGANELQKRGGRMRYVVNGHSHFASMVPLGNVSGNPAVYFNTGTWRTVHQIGHDVGGRPSFLPYDAMSYLVFFPSDDPSARNFEWWTGAMVSAAASGLA